MKTVLRLDTLTTFKISLICVYNQSALWHILEGLL